MSDKILDRIQKILDRANHPNTPQEERDTALAMADNMMKAHQIEEAALRARNVARGLTEAKRHEVTDEEIEWVDSFDEFMPTHRNVAALLAGLAGVEIVFKSGFGTSTIHAVGYPDAIGYFKMLWTGTYLVFSAQLFPKWNRNASPGENIRAFVEAGYKWDYVWHQARKEGQPFTRVAKGETIEVACPPADNGWMKRQLKKAYDATGEEKPKLNHGVKNYRNSYAEGFYTSLRSRVFDMMEQRRRLEAQAEGGAQLVLAKDVDAVRAYFNKLFPPDRLSYGRPERQGGNHAGAAARGRTAAATADLTGGRGGVAGGARRSIG